MTGPVEFFDWAVECPDWTSMPHVVKQGRSLVTGRTYALLSNGSFVRLR